MNQRKYETKVINIYGGPSAGKSVAAAELFATMKKRGESVELVTEVAKDIVHEGRMGAMQHCQDLISAEQNYRQHRLLGQYEYIITDSPLLLGIFYAPDDYYPSFQRFVIEKVQSYTNINFYLDRVAPYDPNGRTQDEDEAREIGDIIFMYLKNEGIPFYRLPADDKTISTMTQYLQEHGTPRQLSNQYQSTVNKYASKYSKYYNNFNDIGR